MGDGQDRVGRVADHAVGGGGDPREETLKAFAAGKGEVGIEGRPAIDQRPVFAGQLVDRVVLPTAEVDLAEIAVELDGQVEGQRGKRLPAPPHRTAIAPPGGEPPHPPGQGLGLLAAGLVQGRVGRADESTREAGVDACMSQQNQPAGHRARLQEKPSFDQDRPRAKRSLTLPSKERAKAPSGILTSESSYLPRPSHSPEANSGHPTAAFVIGYSGGAVLEFHQLPSSDHGTLLG